MKKLILISILFYNYSFTQEYLEWKDRTVSPVVLEVNDLSAQEIYQRISSLVDDFEAYFNEPDVIEYIDGM
tara:strand:+ start:588 stop:800 length:213 start_codon:yes stop_codon:yes gene_type:complete